MAKSGRLRSLPGALLSLGLLAMGCSTLRVMPVADPSELQAGRAYRIMVRADTPELDRIVYELALMELSPILPISEDEERAGTVEVLFSSHEKVATLWGSVGVGTGWYTGGSPSGAVGVGVSSAGPRTYQTATMLVVLKEEGGKRLWSADYRFNGRWTLVAGREAAARRCLRKIAKALRTSLAGVRPPPASHRRP